MDEQKIKEAFRWIDIDAGEGTISSKEIGNALRYCGSSNTSEKDVQEMIAEVGGDTCDIEKFKAVAGGKSKNAVEADLIEAFGVFDTDKSGSITADEFRHVLANVGEKLEKEEIEELFKEGDIQEGGVVDYKEFAKMLLE